MRVSSDNKFNTKRFTAVQHNNAGGALRCLAVFVLSVLLFLSSVLCFWLGSLFRNDNTKSTDVPAAPTVATNINSGNEQPNVLLEIAESVVRVCVYNDSSKSVSTGIVITEDGYILVCDHIFKSIRSPEIAVVFKDGTVSEAAYIGGDDRKDIAVIKVEARDLRFCDFSETENAPEVGDNVYTIGFANEISNMSTVSRGIISATGLRMSSNTDYPVKVFQFDAPISPGDSGGPLVASDGKIIGIITSKLSGDGYEGIGFAIELSYIRTAIDELISNGIIQSRPKLGITFDYISPAGSITEGIRAGLRISSISSESDLSTLGYSKGDTITAINGVKILTLNVFYDAIEENESDKIELTIVKSDGVERKVTVSLLSEKGSSSYEN